MNLIRLLIALALLAIVNAIRLGEAIPFSATKHQWLYLLLSGILGFSIGDLALFRAFVLLGSRLATLLMCLAPIFAAVTEWVWLGGTITFFQLLGMSVTLAGVAWVVYEKPAELPRESAEGGQADRLIESEARLGGAGSTVLEYQPPPTASVRRVTPYAIFLGVVAAVGQGVGLVCTKVGMSTEFRGVAQPPIDAFAATQIRILAGIATFTVLLIVTRRARDCVRAVTQPFPMALVIAGSITGPFLGVSMLNKAVELIPSGVAQTITSLTPVLIIPVSVVVLKEKVNWQAIIGSVVAVAGVAMLVF